MQHDGVLGRLRVVLGITPGPVVAEGVGIDVPVLVEGPCCDRQRVAAHGLQTLLAVLVPKAVGSIPSSSDEGAVDWMEAHGIDGVDVIVVPVALEGEVLALHRQQQLCEPELRTSESCTQSWTS